MTSPLAIALCQNNHGDNLATAYSVTIQRYGKPHTEIMVNKMHILWCLDSRVCLWNFTKSSDTRTAKYAFHEVCNIWKIFISQSCNISSLGETGLWRVNMLLANCNKTPQSANLVRDYGDVLYLSTGCDRDKEYNSEYVLHRRHMSGMPSHHKGTVRRLQSWHQCEVIFITLYRFRVIISTYLLMITEIKMSIGTLLNTLTFLWDKIYLREVIWYRFATMSRYLR